MSGTPKVIAISTSSPAGAAASWATVRRESSHAVQDQVAQLIHVPNTWYTEPQGQLAQALSERTDFAGQCFFCNCGTEANEAAIKLARLNGTTGPVQDHHDDQQLPRPHDGRLERHRPAQVSRRRRAAAARIQLRPVRRSRRGRRPGRSTPRPAPIMVEPIQGEGGVNLPPPGYLEGLRELCDKHKLLLIFDEVQTGMGRTGRWYAYQHSGVRPDIVTLAKALAGGVAMGGLIASPEVAAKLKPGTHAATFGGNPLACRAALATIETIEDDGLLDRAVQIGERLPDPPRRAEAALSGDQGRSRQGSHDRLGTHD